MNISPTSNNGNPGIVPPWLGKTPRQAKNPGIVPPWLTKPAPAATKNPGIVPPWLVDAPRILPVTPNASEQTAFVRESAIISPPMTFADAIRPL